MSFYCVALMFTHSQSHYMPPHVSLHVPPQTALEDATASFLTAHLCKRNKGGQLSAEGWRDKYSDEILCHK